jgi:hypothetical protein
MERLKTLQGYDDKFGINLTPQARMDLEELADLRRQCLFKNRVTTVGGDKRVSYANWIDWSYSEAGSKVLRHWQVEAKSDEEFKSKMIEEFLAWKEGGSTGTVNVRKTAGASKNPLLLSRCAGDVIEALLAASGKELREELLEELKGP